MGGLMQSRFKRFPAVKRAIKTGQFQEASEPEAAAPILRPCPCCGGPQEEPEGLRAKNITFVRCTVCRKISIEGCVPSLDSHREVWT
jgi:hypothetical protein